MDNAGARVQRLRAVRAEHRRIGLVPRHRLLRYRMVAATACVAFALTQSSQWEAHAVARAQQALIRARADVH